MISTLPLITVLLPQTLRTAQGSSRVAFGAQTLAPTLLPPATVITGSAPPPPVLVPMIVTPPTISGTVALDQILTSDDGVWTNTPTSYAYQWTRDGSPISGATSSTYTVGGGADVKTLLRCEVTAINSAGPSTPSASNTLASAWQPIYALKPSALIWDGRDPQCYDGAPTAAPVVTLRAVDGALIANQAVTSRQAIRLATGLDLDGADDHYLCDGLAARFNGAQTLIFGAADLDAPAVPNASNIKTVISSSLSSANHIAMIAIEHPSNSYSRILYAATTSLNLPIATGLASLDIVVRDAGPGGSATTSQLTALLPIIATGTRPATATGYTFAAIGVRRLPALAQYFLGRLRHLAHDTSQWDDADLLVYRDCAIAAGVI